MPKSKAVAVAHIIILLYIVTEFDQHGGGNAISRVIKKSHEKSAVTITIILALE